MCADKRVYGFLVPAILELVEKRGTITSQEVAEKLSLTRAQAQSIICQMQKYYYPPHPEPHKKVSYLVRANPRSERIAVYKRGNRMSPTHLRAIMAKGPKRYVGEVHARGT